jgi:hypothetical protein
MKQLQLFIVIFFFAATTHAQQITGYWQGRIGKRKAEIKIIQKGDSLTGTSYYYESNKNYRRYSIRGYFDQQTNSAVWWDDVLLEETVNRPSGKEALHSTADFNCPGGGKMFLEGEATPENTGEKLKVDLTKTEAHLFDDEWDFVIDNYLVGANDPMIIDSVANTSPRPSPKKRATNTQPPLVIVPTQDIESSKSRPRSEAQVSPPSEGLGEVQIIQKFTTRKKVFKTEIPITADSIELRFYDNAQVDGDSISLFLDDQMIFTHIRLTEKAYTIKLAAKDLQSVSELTMVAENLGSIPPNTSFMVAIVGDKRYEAQLASTENSSAMIRFRKSE